MKDKFGVVCRGCSLKHYEPVTMIAKNNWTYNYTLFPYHIPVDWANKNNVEFMLMINARYF